jgi:MFS transporter, MHS family, citrate/tricarballylate:H+ symporter
MNRFGLRIPLLIGCAIIPLIFRIRRSLSETPAVAARQSTPQRVC